MNHLIADSQSLRSATRNGHSIPIYDDGFGPLFIHRNSIGISGIVRARTWEDAYSICEDEFFPDATETIEEMKAEYGFRELSEKVVHGTAVSSHAQNVMRDGFPFTFSLAAGERLATEEMPML